MGNAADNLRRWRKANPERAREQSRRQRRNDPGRDRRWYLRNIDTAAAANKRWASNNKDRRNAITAARYARKLHLTPPLTADEKECIVAFYTKARALTELTGVPYHVDHKKPLAKGGLHHPDNLQVLRGVDNQRKGAKWNE